MPSIAVPFGNEPGGKDDPATGGGTGEPASFASTTIGPTWFPQGIDNSRNLKGPVLLETDSYYRMPNGTLVPVPDKEPTDGGRAVQAEEKQPFTHKDTRMVPREELVIVTSKGVEFIDDHLSYNRHMKFRNMYKEGFEDGEPATGDFDGDGRDETVVAVDYEDDVAVWVLDDGDKGQFQTLEFRDKLMGVEADEDIWGIHRDSWSIDAGDIDGDGKDEIALVAPVTQWLDVEDNPFADGFFATVLRVILLDDAEEDFRVLTNWTVGEGYLPDITLGDMTGDAREEIIISATEANKWDVNLFLFQYNESSSYMMTPLLDRESGEYWDGDDEGAETYWWGHSVNVGDRIDGNDRQDSEVATGDIDGDGLHEVLVLTGAHERLDEEEDMSTHLDAYDYIPDGRNLSRYKKVPDQWTDFHDDTGWLRLNVQAGDVDGDMIDEIVVAGGYDDDIDAWIFDDAQHSFKQMKRWNHDDGLRPGKRGRVSVGVGDVDCDGKEEVVFTSEEVVETSIWGSYGGEDVVTGLKIWVYDDVKGLRYWEEDGKEKSEADMPELYNRSLLVIGEYPLLALGDIDADGILLQYNGEHYPKMTKPRPIAVLAAPPTYMPNGPHDKNNDFPQNYDLSGTTYGVGSVSGSGTSKSHTDSVHVGASVSFGFESQAAGVEAMTTFSTTMNWEFTQTNSNTELITMAREFTGDAYGDTIIHQTVKFDVYNYTVLSHPDPEAIGSITSIEVPRKDWWYKEYIDYYNSRPYIKKHPEYAIGRDIFKHQVGKPWTYPTVAEADDAIGKAESFKIKKVKEKTFPFTVRKEPRCRYPDYCGGWQSESIYVGQGGGTQAVTIDLSKERISENAKSFSMDFSLTYEATFSGSNPIASPKGGFSVSAGYGFSNTHSTSVITGEETVYQGVVGDISDPQAYEDYGYGFGLFVYNHKRVPSFGYQVLNYYVQDFNVLAAAGARADLDCAVALKMEPEGKYLPDSCLFANSPKVKGATPVAGSNGNALSFDGAGDHVVFEDPIFIAPPGNLTLSANINPESLDNGTILYGGDRGEFRLFLENGSLKFGVHLGAQVGTEREADELAEERAEGGGEGRGGDSDEGGVPLPPSGDNLTILDEPQWHNISHKLNASQAGEWMHITATYSQGDNITLYLNGEAVATLEVPSFTIHDPGRDSVTSIGSTNGSQGDFFLGMIDDVIILKRQLNNTNETQNVDHYLLVTSTGVEPADDDVDEDDDDGAIRLFWVLLPLLILLLLALLLLYWDQLMILLGYKERPEEECVYCGSDEQPLHHGHLVAPSKGGQKPVTACARCNLSKGDKALMDWLRWTKVERPERWELIVKWNREPKEGEVPEKVRKVRDEHTPEPRDRDGVGSGEAKADDDAESCAYCGATEKLTREHVVLKDHEPEAACTSCHLSRSDKELEEWLEYVKDNKEEKWGVIVAHNKGKRHELAGYVRALRDQRDDTCVFCGSQEKIHQTTLVAASKGGKKPVAACEACFRSKGTKAFMDWLRWTKEERPERWESIVAHNKGKRGEVASKVRTVREEPDRASEKAPSKEA